jgi:predicted RecA/RadA family phage recombinase
MSDRERFTDSAGVTCDYTPIEEVKPGDVVIIGWRTTVARVEVEANRNRARVVWEGRESYPDQWNPLGTLLPVEVTDV